MFLLEAGAVSAAVCGDHAFVAASWRPCRNGDRLSAFAIFLACMGGGWRNYRQRLPGISGAAPGSRPDITMSSQAGVFYFDQRPVPREIAEELRGSLGCSASDASGHFSAPGLFMAY